jgi:periplasmic protein TonB
METTVFDKEWVELIFEGRNKNYGAYVIRKQHNENMLWGIAITLGMGVAAIVVPRVITALCGAPPAVELFKHIEVNALDNIKIEDILLPTEQPVAMPKTTVETPPVKVIDVIVPKENPIDVPNNGLGSPNGTGVLPNNNSATGGGTVLPTPIEVPIITAPVAIAEVMPEFIGGEAQMMSFLSSKIKYPAIEKDNNIAGTVYLTFVIETDGSITAVSTLRGVKGGQGLEQEAARVVKLMPRWKPGLQNGKPVRVQFNLPVRFSLH